jgi:hypothetical protein
MEDKPDSFARLMPGSNLRAYCCLYVIETGLRELIIEELSARGGASWHKRHLPGDLLKKLREGRAYERNTPWTDNVPHHPIYYVDFPDLVKTIVRSDNWDGVFDRIFKRKDLLESHFRMLEPIRNKVAHHRKLSSKDSVVLEECYAFLLGLVGETRFQRLAATASCAQDIYTQLADFQREGVKCIETCRECAALGELDRSSVVSSSWWFDADYLGHDVRPIEDYFTKLVAYRSLPRHMGCGVAIREWLNACGMEARFASANSVFEALLRERPDA